MPRALFLSPHFDDVAFSCGGTAFTLAMRGWTTTLCTVFTKSIPNPTGFALACQLDKGLAADVDYLALRRAEDDRAARALAFADVARLDFAEAPHRGYESAAALFGDFTSTDDIAGPLDARLRERIGGYDAIFAPQALGSHVDHRRVRDAVLAIAHGPTKESRTLWYRDAPYVLREPLANPTEPLASHVPATVAFALDARALAAKLDACAAYATQLGFQFGGERSMRDALGDFALAEGRRFGADGPSEAFLGYDSVWDST
ncbi:MAG: PIG-L family deacetylase [Vulcanimicrobiaceae bacterium]